MMTYYHIYLLSHLPIINKVSQQNMAKTCQKYGTNVPPSIGSWRSPIDITDDFDGTYVHQLSKRGSHPDAKKKVFFSGCDWDIMGSMTNYFRSHGFNG